MSTRPVLIINPPGDTAFRALAEAMVADGKSTTDALQRGLRETYPFATVRPRDLSNERTVIWYVYREGHWVPPTGSEEG